MRKQLLLVLGGLAACSMGGLAGPAGEPVADPAGFAAGLRQATIPERPRQVTFEWTLEEGGSRVGGRGVVRTEIPGRIRLDLFGPRGETYLIAALVGDEYRLPPSAAGRVALPSPALLWSALGVLDPPSAAELASATTTPGGADLRYEAPGAEVFAYTFVNAGDDSYRLSQVERAGPRGVIETVAIERGPDGAITRTRYRNWAEFRDLTLEVESIREESSFPMDIWRPDGTSQ